MARSSEHSRPVVITEAAQSGADEFRARKKRYAVLMGIRVLCLIGAVATIHVFWPLAAAFVAGVVVLPWCAVLIANDRPAKKKDTGFRRHVPDADDVRALDPSKHRTIDL